jgi:hypothetical protein
LFEKFLTKLKKDKDSKFDEEIGIKLECLKMLESIEALKTYELKMEKLKCLYTDDPDLEGAANDSAVMDFIRRQKVEIYHVVEESFEIKCFRDVLTKKYLSKRKPCCQCGLL